MTDSGSESQSESDAGPRIMSKDSSGRTSDIKTSMIQVLINFTTLSAAAGHARRPPGPAAGPGAAAAAEAVTVTVTAAAAGHDQFRPGP
jgi:hypothetical protein